MSFDWRSYVDISAFLVTEYNRVTKREKKESYLRSCVSRAYYGVFCYARDILKSQNVLVPKNDVHSFVITKYKELRRFDIALKLEILRDFRRDADYDTDCLINLDCAEKCLNMARDTLELLENLSNNIRYSI